MATMMTDAVIPCVLWEKKTSTKNSAGAGTWDTAELPYVATMLIIILP